MRIAASTVYADDQEKAVASCTLKLGFVKKSNIPVGEARWLTAPTDANGVDLVLGPDSHPAVGPFKSALNLGGIGVSGFGVEDIRTEYEPRRSAGAWFTQSPVLMGPAMTAAF